ncbi:MAG: hypothetical protein JKY30_10780 [Flavobacteriales bacterium]|nr:hypothetical protein [Flavobacteriales bacterium]
MIYCVALIENISELKGSNNSNELSVSLSILWIADRTCAFFSFKTEEVGCCNKENSIACFALLISLLSK